MNDIQYEKLLARVERGGSDQDTQQLLGAFFSGYSVENLKRLLGSDNEGAVRAGAWIASELGTQAAPILPLVFRLLEHDSREVRFFILDVVLSCAGHNDGVLLAGAVGLVRDADSSVRWKAMQFLSRATKSQLIESGKFQVDDEIRFLTSWLVSVDGTSDLPLAVKRQLNSQVEVARMFAVTAAARSGSSTRELLAAASKSTDQQIKNFAEDQLLLLE